MLPQPGDRGGSSTVLPQLSSTPSQTLGSLVVAVLQLGVGHPVKQFCTGQILVQASTIETVRGGAARRVLAPTIE